MSLPETLILTRTLTTCLGGNQDERHELEVLPG